MGCGVSAAFRTSRFCEFVRELEAAQAKAGHDYELDFGVNTIEQQPKTAVATF